MQKLLFTTMLWCSGLGMLGAQVTSSLKVVNDQGQALAGAVLWVPSQQVGAVSDSAGVLVLPALPAGRYGVSISYLGYRPYLDTLNWGGTLLPQITLEPGNYPIETWLVRGTRAGALTPMTYLNLSRAQIAANNLGQDLPYLLQWTPSIVVTSDAGNGIGYTGLRIRGTDPTRINVTINGIPLNDAESQGVFWVNLPDFASSVGDIQIQRGVGASTNGPGAFGATINLNTNTFKEKAYATAQATLGSFGTLKTNLQFGSGKFGPGFTLDGRVSRIVSEGYIDRARANLRSFFLSGAWVGAKNLLRLNVFSGHEVTYQAWYGVPAELADDWATRTTNLAGTEKPGEPYDNEVDDYRQTHYQLLYAQQLGQHWQFNGAVHYTRGQGFFEQYKADQALGAYLLPPVLRDGVEQPTDLVRQLWLANDFFGGIYTLHYHRSRWNLTLGGGWNRYLGEQFGRLPWIEGSTAPAGFRYYDNDSRKTDFNIYAKAQYSFAAQWHLYVDLQWRQWHYRVLGPDAFQRPLNIAANAGFWNPKMGLLFQPQPNESFYASLAVANREPNRDDFVNGLNGATPRPERLYDGELGWKKQLSWANWELTAYYLYYRDQLALSGNLNEVGSGLRINIDRSYRLGLEGAGKIGWKQWALEGNFNWSRNRVQAFTERQDVFDENFNALGAVSIDHVQTALAFSPPWVGGAAISWQLGQSKRWLAGGRLEASWWWRSVARQYLDNTSDPANIIPAYNYQDLRLGWTRSGRGQQVLKLSAWVQNFWNARYASNGWSYRYQLGGQTVLDRGLYPQAGRNFLLAIELGF